MSYIAPVEEIVFTLETVAGLSAAREAGAAGELTADDTRAILSEAGRFAETTLAPLNAVGDTEASRLENGGVVTPAGWREAYRSWAANGWGSLTGDEAFGGQGLPMALQVAAADIWNQANAAFALGPILSIAAVEALQAHGSPAQKERFLPKLISGEWAGTMNLTEPQSGSDLGGLKTYAVPDGDGFRLFGQKIYISYGDHDLTDNIVHMVLARLPDAPEGSRGISLFVVPKFIVNDDGSLAGRNDIACVGVEHKIGIHASPTCTMVFGAAGDGAYGTLVGTPHKGLAHMFTMMNNARVQVGMQGAAVAERATQHALAYAKERRQGRAPGTSGDMAPIIAHPDVKRMLMSMRAFTKAARSICYACAVAIDRGRPGLPDAPFWKARADLLTPIAKAFSTEVGVDVASTGIQVHGGMGYVEETGAGQYWRDARIFPIYEGTNGIQAIDLVRRKITADDGAVLAAYLAELRGIADAARGSNQHGLARLAGQLDEAIDAVAETAEAMRQAIAADEASTALCGASTFLNAIGLTAGGAYLTQAALSGESDAAERRAALARFFGNAHLTRVPAESRSALVGAPDILAADEDILSD